MSLHYKKSHKQHNPLLVKGAVGKIRPTVYDLPGEDHIYGKAVVRDPLENAATVIHHWNIKATSKETVPALDYITMNRNSARLGLNSPKEIRKFRKDHPVRRKEGDQSMYKAEGVGNGAFTRSKAPLPSDKNSLFTYGKPNRPSTPVALLMTDRFQQEWNAKRQQALAEQEQAEKVNTI
ncbi:hypothetical protein HDU91_000676 [Kappamyces sp. JEL0680]|nr:hypothetical protein HDU91_000676 [Kappamyces sp. JEL0680]